MTFAQSLRDKKLLKGTILSTASAEIAEAISHTGIDWVFIDMEHAPLTIPLAQNLVRATSNRVGSVIRIPDHSPTWIKQALDTGCDGIIIPQVNTAAEAEAIVSAARYAPKGNRSVGITRAHTYGQKFQETTATANNNVAIIAQIENIEAVKNIDSILSVDGIDAIFIGPYDLSASMNKIGQVKDSDVIAAIGHVLVAAKKKNIAVGMFTADIEGAKAAINKGVNLLAVGIDVGLLMGAVKNIAELRISQ